MGDDAELYIESGGDPTTLLDYEYIFFEKKNSARGAIKKKNTMVFIDAESVGANRAAQIIGQSRAEGEIYEVRYYALQKDPSVNNWRESARKYGIKPILLSGEPSKNKVDNKISKDIKSILSTNKSIDVFCIATRDGDYVELVNYVRKRGKKVVVFATKNTSSLLKKAASEVKGI